MGFDYKVTQIHVCKQVGPVDTGFVVFGICKVQPGQQTVEEAQINQVRGRKLPQKPAPRNMPAAELGLHGAQAYKKQPANTGSFLVRCKAILQKQAPRLVECAAEVPRVFLRNSLPRALA